MASTFGPRIEKEPYFTSSPYEPVRPPPQSLDEINLSDVELYTKGDFHAAVRLLQEQSPIYWHTNGGAKAFGNRPYWAVTSHEGFMQVIRNHDVFSSVHPVMDRTSEEQGLHDLFFSMDGQEHKSYRVPVERYTNAKAINAAKQAIDRAIRADIAEFAKSGGTDLAPLCYYSQGSVAVAFYGLEGDEAERLRDICRGLVSWSLTPSGLDTYSSSDGMTKLFSYVEHLLADRRKNPRDDIFTALAKDEDEGRLNHKQVFTYLWFTMSNIAGTACNAAIINPIIALLHHPEQFKIMRENRDHIESGRAAEEALRWGGNSIHLARQATEDTEVLGQPIKKGDVVVVFQTAANRDPTVFEDPYRFDVTKQRRKVMTFGTGKHACLGAFLMRTVATSVLRGLAETYESLEQTGPLNHHMPYSLFVTEVSTIPVRGTLAKD